MVDLELTGCRPEPLGSYLKALGVLRMVAEQADREARGFWHGEVFVLRSRLGRDDLLRFFNDAWQPTPVVAPWNGGSGFYPKDNKDALVALLERKGARFAWYRRAIEVAQLHVAAQGWTERPEKEEKAELLVAMRSTLPDEALAWLDAAVVVSDDRLFFPPLLGTGGNDGRLDFSNNFMQRVVEVTESADGRLSAALFDQPIESRFAGTMGQYSPASGERTNPWDFVLLIEGALVFAGAATRRFEGLGPGQLAYPFHARAAGGTATVADGDGGESRDELWLPLWSAPSTLRELRRMFAEGRAKLGQGEAIRSAASGLDFARSIAQLGVDRGIHSFARVGFHARNGLAYFATPLGRYATGAVPGARLLDELDGWFERFRRAASGDRVPATVRVVARRLEDAFFAVATGGSPSQVLLALADVERALARSLSFATGAFLTPVPELSGAWWDHVEDSVEARLGGALRLRPLIRKRMLPVNLSEDSKRRMDTFGRSDDPATVFRDRALVDNLHGVLLRDEQEGRVNRPGAVERACTLADIAEFVRGDVDDGAIERWARALTILKRPESSWTHENPHRPMPPVAFALLALVHGRELWGDVSLHRTSNMLSRACSGDAVGATEAAIRRLRSAGKSLPMAHVAETKARTRRIAAALAFPLTLPQRNLLEDMVFSREARESHAIKETSDVDV